MMSDTAVLEFVCEYCEKVYRKKKILYEHIRCVHKVPIIPAGNRHCPIEECSFSCKTSIILCTHIKSLHQISLEESSHKFDKYEEFLLWKEKEESERKVSFFLKNSVTLKNKYKRIYFFCNRSGFSQRNSKGLRAEKSQGSCKINSHCPSSLEVTIKQYIEVKYIETHLGHNIEIAHLPLPKQVKDIVAGKLYDGVAPKKIIDAVRSTIDEDIGREHLITVQDVKNIASSLCLDDNEKLHPVDSASVDMWVRQMDALGEDSPVLYYKEQGKCSDSDILHSEDFCLILMSNVQKQILQKYGENCINCDSTHGTNGYNFQLTTLLVVDDFNSGFPVAFCFSNHVDIPTMQIFFTNVKNKVGNVVANTFMSDDTQVYYSAWSTIMTPPKHRRLCLWHVKRNLLKACVRIKPGKREEVKKYIRLLCQVSNINEFKILMSDFESKLAKDNDTANFGQYFSKYYATRVELWAPCFQPSHSVSTNNHLESMHKVLKYTYMNGVKNKRLDKCVGKLLQMVQDKWFQNFIRAMKGVKTHKINLAHMRHRRAAEMSKDRLIQGDDATWKVVSEDGENEYIINKNENTCSKCPLICQWCKVCLHQYFCTCPDFVIKSNMCKHIHFMLLQKNKEYNSVQPTVSVDMKVFKNFNEIKVKKQSKKHHVQTQLETISGLLSSKEVSSTTLGKFENIFNNIIEILKTEEKFNVVEKEPGNKKMKKQVDFFSTKRKRTATKEVFTAAHKKIMLEAIGKEEALHVHTGFDHVY